MRRSLWFAASLNTPMVPYHISVTPSATIIGLSHRNKDFNDALNNTKNTSNNCNKMM